MKRKIIIVMLGVVGIAILATGCSSGPRCYGNSVYDNNIYNFYMNGRKDNNKHALYARKGSQLFTDGISEHVELKQVSYQIMP
jgi:hypothetical protein